MIPLIMAVFALTYLTLPHVHRVQPWHQLPLTGLDGKPLPSAAWHGRFVLLNFWSTDCAACLAEMPVLEKASIRYGASGLNIVGVALPYDDPNQVAAVAALSHVTYPQSWDSSGQLDKLFGGIAVVPTTVLVDRDGKIVFRQEGPLNDRELASLVQAYGLDSKP
ncbi:TlpA disulfide reductase family protein [Dyella flava]|uniref:TlpA family protein disulfide reductase n=1 Tax=Dyella flava TaxID=1920170 RepID=A0ABS2JZZ2_9GAMM|nr:TlpA disulfide reductase family protein [Dyella flava]MBM7124566.1 TlpA family protein disulfide reductase [Dyella flava]GLQ49218.1 thioredoxin [Dyella flava]